MKPLEWSWLLALLMFCGCAQCQGILIPATSYAVQGAPFTLTVETHWDHVRDVDPKESTQRILRDSAGRQRYEAPVDNGLPRSFTVGIYDVVAGKYIKLHLNTRTAEVAPMRVGHSVTLDASIATSLAPPTAADGQTLLGIREIAGLEAWGQRSSKTTTLPDGTPFPQDREVWTSTHYAMPLMQIVRTERGKTTQTVVSFDPAEPDPALFRIPEGFAVSDAPAAPEPPPGIARVGGNVKPPIVLKSPMPEFSEEARHKKVGGDVLVYLVVDEQGKPQNVRVIRGIGMGLDEKAVEAVRQYTFKPAMRDGVPVKVEMQVQVNFQIFGKPQP